MGWTTHSNAWVAVALACLACNETPQAPAKPAPSVATTVPSQPRGVAPSASVAVQDRAPRPRAKQTPSARALAPAKEDCAPAIFSEAWYPVLTRTMAPTAACGATQGCTPVVTRRETRSGYADGGCRCNALLAEPRLKNAPTAQRVLGAAWQDFVGDLDGWLCAADFVVHYNANDTLSLTFRMSGNGAYPDTQVKPMTLKVSSGRLLSGRDVFLQSRTNELVSRIDQLVQTAITKAPTGFKKQADVFEATLHFEAKHLDQFVVTERGLLFYFDFGLPHAVQALTPTSEYLLPFDEVTEFLDPYGQLGWAAGS